MNELNWPPKYTLRRSKRAKRINLKLCAERGLTVVIPHKSSENVALEFLQQQKSWILKHQHLIQTDPPPIQQPTSIHLAALKKTWTIRYEIISGYKKIKLLQLPQELVLYGAELPLDACIKELTEWLYLIAEKELLRWLKQLSQRTQLSFKQMSIRNQMTRWGSCSHEKNINLNFKLLFLPAELTEYVLIHELCHTKFLDHSENFWHLVASYLPNYSELMLQLKKINKKDFPNWI